MISIIKIMDELYSETYFQKYRTAEYELARTNYDQKQKIFLQKLDADLQKEFNCLKDLYGQIEFARESELMQFVFDFCCNLFFCMFPKNI